jgi:hypothetical protein
MSSSADKPSENKFKLDESKPDENEIKQNKLYNLKKSLEAKGMQQVKDLNLIDPQTSEVVKNLTNIMQSGFDEFKKETGREMTYSEMRELYG